MHACGAHWSMLGRQVLLPAAGSFDLLYAQSDDEYTSCRWLALALQEEAPRFGGELFHLWHGICDVSQLIVDEVYARSSLRADFQNVSEGSKYLWRWSALFERRACDQLEYLVPYECVEVFSFTEFAQVPRYVPLPPKWASIKVPVRCAALPLSFITHLDSRLRNNANSGLWILVYTGCTASCAYHVL